MLFRSDREREAAKKERRKKRRERENDKGAENESQRENKCIVSGLAADMPKHQCRRQSRYFIRTKLR